MKDEKRISQMRNLGPAVERDLNAAGLYHASEVEMLGPEKTFLRMLEGRRANGRSAKCCNALYLYALYGAVHDIDWRDIPDAQKQEFKSLTDRLRKSGRFT